MLTDSVIALPASPLMAGINGPCITVELPFEPAVVSIIYRLKQVISSENVNVVIGFPSVKAVDVCTKLPSILTGSRNEFRELY